MLMLLATNTDLGGAQERRELDGLLSGVAAGDREAFARLYRRTRTAVYGLALSYVKNAHDAQDVAQDAFVRVWDRAHQYRPGSSPMGWLLTITRNLALMKLRQSSRQTDLEPEEWDAIPEDSPAVTPEDRQILQTALAALADGERQIVLLHAAAGLKHREIAALLELPLPTVLSKYHRALKKLKVQLEGDDPQ